LIRPRSIALCYAADLICDADVFAARRAARCVALCSGTSGAPIDFAARRVVDPIVDPRPVQETTEPETIASGLVARENGCVLGQPEPHLRPLDFPEYPRQITRRH
jgi:hypothetical protein